MAAITSIAELRRQFICEQYRLFRVPATAVWWQGREEKKNREPIFHVPEQLEIVQLNLLRYQGH
jgi:hypothetical protein